MAQAETKPQAPHAIGLIGGVPQPVVVDNKLKNVPEKGVYSWSPTAYFGVYKPDSFWFETR